MSPHTCPWWFAYTFDHPLRRPFHNVARMFAGRIDTGITVMDVGCGMGYFSIGLARLLGPAGRVLAVDLQSRMLTVLMRRAEAAGVAERIEPRQCTRESLKVDERVDAALVFWMAHEVEDRERLFGEIAECLAPGGPLFLAEPKGHVGPAAFQGILGAAAGAGLEVAEPWPVRFSRGAVLARFEPPMAA